MLAPESPVVLEPVATTQNDGAGHEKLPPMPGIT